MLFFYNKVDRAWYMTFDHRHSIKNREAKRNTSGAAVNSGVLKTNLCHSDSLVTAETVPRAS